MEPGCRALPTLTLLLEGLNHLSILTVPVSCCGVSYVFTRNTNFVISTDLCRGLDFAQIALIFSHVFDNLFFMCDSGRQCVYFDAHANAWREAQQSDDE